MQNEKHSPQVRSIYKFARDQLTGDIKKQYRRSYGMTKKTEKASLSDGLP